jgi:hypothetical protein
MTTISVIGSGSVESGRSLVAEHGAALPEGVRDR